MKFNIELGEYSPEMPVRVGHVYPIKGGYGTREKHMMVLIAITKDQTGLMLVIDRNGNPQGTSSYLVSRLEERMPIGFVHGLSELEFSVMPL